MADEAGENIIDPRDAAESAGLIYIDDQGSGITRRKSGKGWSYRDATGGKISDKAVIERINRIGIPPAYTDVWICADERGHTRRPAAMPRAESSTVTTSASARCGTAPSTSTC